MATKTYLQLSQEQFKQLKDYPDNVPVKMLNLLKFKKDVGGRSGASVYNDYLKAVEPFFLKSKASILFQGKPELCLIGPTEKEWDKVLLVGYESKADFLKMVTSEGYPAEIREQALENSRLILCS